MAECTIKVNNYLEPSAVALLVQAASKFSSRVSLSVDEKTANAKSIMGIISLNMQEGQNLQIAADGPDASEAIQAMQQFFA